MRRGTTLGVAGIIGILAASSLLPFVPVPLDAPDCVPHVPILILGNGDFKAANGVTRGSGTPEDPYVIEGWDISASSADGVLIRNTDAHFVIRNVCVHSGRLVFEGIELRNVTNGRVEHVRVWDNDGGIVVDSSVDVTIVNNNATSNLGTGISVLLSSAVHVTGNRVSSPVALFGIHLVSAFNTTVTGNVVESGDSGVGLFSVRDVDIAANEIEGYRMGVYAAGSLRVAIVGNNVTATNGTGIYLWSSTGVRVHHNNMLNSPQQAFDSGAAENAWDDGYPSGGNYWSDYTGVDACSGPGQNVCPDPDGIGDTPYVIDSDSRDRYPLMLPFARNQPPAADAGGLYVGTEGLALTFDASRSFDPDGDALTYRWDFDGDGTWDTDWSPDPTATHTFGDDWVGTARVEVSDGALAAIAEAPVAVRNVAPTIEVLTAIVTENDPRTIGYWGRQCEVDEDDPPGEHTGIPQPWVDRIGAESRAFLGIATKAETCAIVSEGDAQDMGVMARRQLMGVWLNLVSGKLHAATPLDMPSLTTAATVAEAIAEAEDILLAASERFELEGVKDVADAINNGRGIALAVVDFRAAASDLGSDDLTFAWDFGDGGPTVATTYFNNGVSPDPLPSPDINPITATDVATHAFAAAGTHTVTLTVTDDDGGFVVVSLQVRLG